jgi:hypothetical protein
MASINMVEARQMLIDMYEANEPFMFLGKPGMGKTSMVEDVCHCLGIGFIDFRLTLKDPVEVGGMRVPDVKTGMLRHFVPEDIPDVKRHGPKGIFLFDEINVVSMLLQSTAYGIIQERRIGSYKIDLGWVPMASGNLVTDRAAAQRLSTALANRFNVQVVEPHLPSWLKQYGSEHVDSRGTAFLRFRPALFSCMPGQVITIDDKTQTPVSKDETAFPSARSWTKAFKFIDKPPTYRRKIFAGYVGEVPADEFEAYWRIMENAVSVEQVIADPKGAPIPKEEDAGTYYAVTGMLSRAMDLKNINPIMTYVGRMHKDYQVVCVTDAMRRDEALRNTRAYGNWAVNNQDVMM